MKFKSLCSAAIISMLVLTGCSSNAPTKEEAESNNQNQQVETDISSNGTEKENVDNNNEEEKEESEALNTEESQEVVKSSILELGEPAASNMDVLTLYTCGDDEKPKAFKQVNIDKSLSLKEKVQILCDYLSENVLNDVKFEVTIDENNIAQVNVIESGNSFQGSTGSMITYDVITETLLQANSMDKWIDGFRLLANGDPNGVIGHIELDGSVTTKN